MASISEDYSTLETEIIVKKDNFKLTLKEIAKDFVKILIKETKDKRLDMKQQLKGFGVSKKLFGIFLKTYGEDVFIDTCVPYLSKDIEINLEKKMIQTIEFYEDKDHYAEISKKKNGDYLIQKFKKGKDYQVKK